ncbi:hypothetical protein [Tolumonas osonensis]|uniref:Uncharacterized protein n=1 Tax=Tolumonas osonensis TaxID=675874 RepID=A0A841GM70_9GAMM|nr:hypothetical protein [Tolumonas osonensis]MBB6056221.1 hypothetical protein [Tolumonas osonensis]
MKKSLMVKSALIILALSSINIAHARQGDGNGNGGLMKEMMSKKYQVSSIHDPVKQKNLSKIKFQGQHIQGGLMKEMYLAKHPQKVITDLHKQEQLSAIKIIGGHIDGGLMKEMQDELAAKNHS